MNIRVSKSDGAGFSGDLTVFFIPEKHKKVRVTSITGADRFLARARKSGDFTGREGDTLLYYNDDSGPARVMFIGIGKDPLDQEGVRLAMGRALNVALKLKAAKMMVVPPEGGDLPVVRMAESLSEGAMLAAYRFRKYRKQKEDEAENEISDLYISAPAATAAMRRGVALGMIKASAACFARDMANEPGNVWTPEAFAAAARDLAKNSSLSCRVLGEKEMRKAGMGGLLGVNQGSGKPPRMIILEYNQGEKPAPPLLLVGKGLTFDSGGISLKPGAGMEDMKYDMCGGACVLAVMRAVAELAPRNLHLVAIVPATENLPGPDALKPGDIITICDGTTVEVVNTDAEGRLILADALAYGIKKYKPGAIIDVATLTGAAIIGLGHHRTAMLSNDDGLATKLAEAGETSGEPLWRMPLGKEYAKQLESKVADMKNVGGRAAGTITAACFLEKFVDSRPWAHLDIAGTAWNYTEKSYVPKGPSGVGVRTLIELILKWKG